MHSRERGGHLEVFLLRDGIKLMIVTTGAMHRQPEKALSYRSHDIFHFVLPHDPALLVPVGLETVEGSTDEKPGRSNRSGVIRLKHVPGNLPLHELIIRHILIEGINHPVPIRPCVRAQLVIFKSITLPIAGHVQPVPSPALSVMRRRKKSIHICSDSRFRRQTGQPEMKTSADNAFTRLRCRLQPLLLKLSEDEGINRIAHPTGILHHRNLRTRYWL